MSRFVARALRGLAPASLTLLLLACGGEYPQSSILPKSDFAAEIHELYKLVFYITLGILVVVWGVLAYILVRYRARPGAPKPRQTHGHLGLEITWTIIPAIIVVVIAIPTIRTVFATQRPPEGERLVVDVIGHQFWWEFRYPNGIVTANQLHLPVGVPISLRMVSADVIHSFWVPTLGGKRDVNPAVAEPPLADGQPTEPGRRYNYIHLTITEPGIYRGQCAEFCGASHSIMGLHVVAQPPQEFETWSAAWLTPPAPVQAAATDTTRTPEEQAAIAAGGDIGGGGAARIELGRQVFHSTSCVACHAIQGTTAMGALGPNLTMLGQRGWLAGWIENNPENLARWITAPHDIKPGARMPGVAEPGGNFPATNLSEEQVRAVSEYLYSLGRSSEEAR